MKRFKLSLLILGIFFTGYFTATVTLPIVVPPLNAKQTKVQLWEYYCVLVGEGIDSRTQEYASYATTTFQEFGQQGWILAGTMGKTNSVACFKRPM